VIWLGFTNTSIVYAGSATTPVKFGSEITLDERSSDPTTTANEGALYTKLADGETSLFYRSESSGAVYQLTPTSNLSPWTESSGVVYPDNTTDNVVIGATAMVGAEKFRVVGDTSLQGNVTFEAGAAYTITQTAEATPNNLTVKAQSATEGQGARLVLNGGDAGSSLAADYDGGMVQVITGAAVNAGTAGSFRVSIGASGSYRHTFTDGLYRLSGWTGTTQTISVTARAANQTAADLAVVATENTYTAAGAQAGHLWLTGGSCTGGGGTATGGNANLDAGTGDTNGNVNIGGTNAVEVNLGSPSNSVDVTITIDDNASSFVVKEGSNEYLSIDTSDGAESITLGNTGTNPSVVFSGSGLVSMQSNTLAVGAAAMLGSERLLVNGDIVIDGSGQLRWDYQAGQAEIVCDQAPGSTQGQALVVQSGSGGDASGDAAGAGNYLQLIGGIGGDGDATYAAGAGGAAGVYGGAAGVDGGAGGANGGTALVRGGASSGDGTGGGTTVEGGASSGAADAGFAVVRGGNASGAGDGGAAWIYGGTGTTDGVVYVGTVQTSQVNIAASGVETWIYDDIVIDNGAVLRWDYQTGTRDIKPDAAPAGSAAQALRMTAGTGGAASGAAGSEGGTANFLGGLGGAGDGTYAAGTGGTAALEGGPGGGDGGAGGGQGGAASVTGGIATGSENGGNATVAGGSSPSATGGNVFINGGSGGATDGSVYVGQLNTNVVYLGNATDNPNISQLGTGTVSLSGNVDANSGLDVSGAAFTFTGTAGSWTMALADSALTQTGTGQVTFTGNVDANSGLDVSGAPFAFTGTNIDLDPTGTFALDMNAAQAVTISVSDNLANAFLVQQGANAYIDVTTTDTAEKIEFGNATTNPDYEFLGSGSVKAKTVVFDEYENGNFGATPTLDWNNGQKQHGTLSANATFTFTAPAADGNFTLRFTQGAGGYTVTWPAAVKWPGGTAPNLNPQTGGEINIVTFYYDGTSYYGQAALDFQ
jgi:hypothetical protein